MSAAYLIKQITENDIDAFYPLFEKSTLSQFPEYTEKTRQYFLQRDYSKEKLIEAVRNKMKYFYGAEDNGSIVGYLIGYRVFGGIGFCEWLGVDKAHHKKGIGSALLKAYEQTVFENGGHKIHLWCIEGNIPFYEKNGFILAGRIPENYFGSDDCLMYKPLRAAEEKNYLR